MRFEMLFWGVLLVALVGIMGTSPADTFTKQGRTIKVGPNPCDIVAPDLNGDGIPEIITADRGILSDPTREKPANDELSFLVAREPMAYVTQPPLRAGFAPWAIVVENMDALKAPDLVVVSFHETRGRNLSLFLNIGDNLFNELHFPVPEDSLEYKRQRDIDDRPLFTVPGLTALVIRDFDGDGYRDAVATGWSGDVLVYFPGENEKYLGEPSFFQAPGGPRDIQAADLNGDGHTDLVTTMYATGEIALWKGDGSGGFSEVDRFLSRGRLPHKIRIADVNGDGHKDLAVSDCHAYDAIHIYYGAEGFAFPTCQEILFGEDRSRIEEEVRDILVEDLNADGRVDLAAACFASGQVCILLNESTGTGCPQVFRSERYPFSDGRPRALCTADFNQDGKKDVAVTLWEENVVSFLMGR